MGKLERHMEDNFGWELSKLVEQKRLVLLQIDPLELAESVKGKFKDKGMRRDEFDIQLPFRPDRLVLDSLTVLGSAFIGNSDVYRVYLSYLLRTLERTNSVNLVISETPRVSIEARTITSGVEEFICDGAIQLYDIRKKDMKQNALEVMKARWGAHSKKLVPYKITKKGFEVFPGAEVFI